MPKNISKPTPTPQLGLRGWSGNSLGQVRLVRTSITSQSRITACRYAALKPYSCTGTGLSLSPFMPISKAIARRFGRPRSAVTAEYP